jgi:catechol 2,3-dioxygenase-like lactoylglutathione lyase family enzyme
LEKGREDAPVLPHGKRKGTPVIRITITSVLVDDQEKALNFYTNVLGFEKKFDIDVDEGARWLTVVSPANPDGVELLLEPDGNPAIAIDGEPAAQVWKRTLYEAGIPATMFGVDDINAEYDRLKGLGVRFTMEPTNMGPVTIAVLDDTCGNLIQIAQMNQQ